MREAILNHLSPFNYTTQHAEHGASWTAAHT